MRFPSISQYRNQVNMLTDQYARLAALQLQSSSGKKLLQSSDDPVLADRMKSIQSHIDDFNAFSANLVLADSRQGQKETVINQSLNILGRIQEIIQQAQNGTENDAARQTLAKEMSGFLDQFLTLANTQDMNREYLFSGINSQVAPFRNTAGQYSYQGSDQGRDISIGLGIKIPYTVDGNRIFGEIPTGNGVFACGAHAGNTGTGVLYVGQIINQAAYVSDHYTLDIVTNSQGALAYSIRGDMSGQVVPALPATVPDDAPAYQPDTDIYFNGMTIQLSGAPAAGDSFDIQPSVKQSVFESISALAALLNTSTDGQGNASAVKQGLVALQQNFEQISSNFRSYLQTVGQEGKIIENQQTLASNLVMDEEIFLKSLSDVDYSQLLTEISQQNLSLQLTQKVYLQIQETRQYMLMKS